NARRTVAMTLSCLRYLSRPFTFDPPLNERHGEPDCQHPSAKDLKPSRRVHVALSSGPRCRLSPPRHDDDNTNRTNEREQEHACGDDPGDHLALTFARTSLG